MPSYWAAWEAADEQKRKRMLHGLMASWAGGPKHPRFKHGLRQSAEYDAWRHMKRRCNSVKDSGYKNYGARGISYDLSWETFACFIADMGMRPSIKHTLERRDNNGNYCKANCCWATRATQNKNRRSSHPVNFRGNIYRTQTDAALAFGLNKSTLHWRLKVGWSLKRALLTPLYGNIQT